MPVVPTTAFVTVETVANLLRVLANDTIFSAAGEILIDTGNLLFPLMNDSLEWMTNELANHGVDSYTKETVLLAVTPIGTIDPGLEVNISDTGYFNNTVNFAQPMVPTDLLVPTFMWERQSNSREQWLPMQQVLGGLPSFPQGFRLKVWEWRQDGIYMLGATQTNDLRLRYKSNSATLATPNDQLMFRGATGTIAYKTLASYLIRTNPEAAQLADGMAMKRLGQLTTRNARMKQSAPTSRRSYGSPQRNNFFQPPRN
jgi:hypothetical protein